jgi:hypothetical protein
VSPWRSEVELAWGTSARVIAYPDARVDGVLTEAASDLGYRRDDVAAEYVSCHVLASQSVFSAASRGGGGEAGVEIGLVE